MQPRRNILNRSIIITISGMAFAYVGWRLWGFQNWDAIVKTASDRLGVFIAFTLMQIVLQVINFMLESTKWHALILTIHHQTLRQSIWQTLGGTTVGAITPARLGEPAGRLWGIPKEKRLKALILGFLGGILLSLIITIGGLTALIFFNPFQTTLSAVNLTHAAWMMALIISGIWIWHRFIRPDSLKAIILKIQNALKMVTGTRLALLSLLTAARYICFAAQLLLWFKFFSPTTALSEIMAPLAIYYLMVTVIPSFFVADLGIRGSIGVFIFSLTGINIVAIISAIFCQWLITTCGPTLLGSLVYLWSSEQKNNTFVLLQQKR
ncbi:lysylphosphatidylglycerol synthase-like protein [Breznakibacter xylanolyticus]|uniref:Lysylphosphatidylglycerol synthase-like protein n=1 Tax=Breznakibacter xylanolyticus TaxID=990 RepID=A0A2W7NZQ2_9BACT|nr:lysylphosphatidylglycerol synthase domain-containing protein [Breznakibacter xylanolyticus]MBN2744636.1 flippase-like domain-containing protein [Marinilabiliaceae bacterium]PZX16692.1 lysylphosphatidylglycerol synthase-like protein [Breznakibacter xylanolyticus]